MRCMDENSKEWQDEQQRVNEVKEEIKRKKRKLGENVQSVKRKVIELRKNFWEDVTVNLDEPDDVIETEASIKQQAELLSERERSHRQLSEQLKVLDRLQDSPYFGRIDFLEDGETEVDRIYIGIGSLMDAEEENFLIYDWRAPISSLYYDYPPGPAEYETVDSTITGDMKLKRQFIIRDGQIKGMFNTGLTIGDHLLQKVLGHNANTTMKNIVATIQKEQNQIIRNEKAKVLIVQGVAGSGKTSAALQRVAYLLYRYRQSLSSENIMLFSPNSLFNSYVSTVLPELGEENMKQTTFEEHAEERLGKEFTIETPFDQMEYYLTKSNAPEYPARIAGIRYKASPVFKDHIDQFLKSLKQDGLLFRNITFRGKKLISKEQIHDFFYRFEPSTSIPNRLEEVSRWLLEELQKIERAERKKDWVLEEAALLKKEDYVKAFEKLSERDSFSEDSFDDFDREEYLLRKLVVARRFKGLKRKIEKLQFVNIKATYVHFFADYAHQNGWNVPEEWSEICNQTVETIRNGNIFYEDVSPYLYFLDQIQGFTINRNIRHVFIDEAQDYSPFQFAYIKEMFPYSRITLLGDFNQAIYAHTFETGTILNEQNESNTERITLLNSYRSTEEIVEFTKDLIEKGEEIRPFNREGSKPKLFCVDSDEELYTEMENTIHALKEKGYETVAVICKTMEESERAYRELAPLVDVKLVGPEAKTFQKGVLIIPAYLAKGIEFDAVIIHNASQRAYHMEYERNLFYTACTRAMHELILYSVGEISPFIKEVSTNKYDQVK